MSYLSVEASVLSELLVEYRDWLIHFIEVDGLGAGRKEHWWVSQCSAFNRVNTSRSSGSSGRELQHLHC